MVDVGANNSRLRTGLFVYSGFAQPVPLVGAAQKQKMSGIPAECSIPDAGRRAGRNGFPLIKAFRRIVEAG